MRASVDSLSDCENDYHSILLRGVAAAMGIEAHYIVAPYGGTYAMPIRWLTFVVGGRRYCYAAGWLVEAGRDPWGRLGRHINEDATILIRDKMQLKVHLAERGFGVPSGQVYRRTDLAAALRAFDRFSGPVCVKPNQGTHGGSVVASINTREEYEAAIRRVAAKHQKILVEDSVVGSVIRFFYVRPTVVAAKLSRPASVVGDGICDLTGLIEAKNIVRQRRAVPGHLPIVVDDEVRRFLGTQGRKLEDVPAAGERVFLRGTSNSATGADSIAAPGLVHPSYFEVIGAACNSVPGLNISAADVMIRDPGEPAAPGNYWILEMNRNPGVTSFHHPWKGKAQNVCEAVLDLLERGCPPESQTRS